MRKETIMDDYRMDEHRICGRHKWWKYLGIVLATLVGAFFAFYFAVSCALSHLMSPAYAMHKMHKMDRMAMRDFKEFDKDMSKMSKTGMFFQHKSAVEFIKTPDSYKFIVDLTPFQTCALPISYSLSPKANIEKLSKKKVDNKYVITVPIED